MQSSYYVSHYFANMFFTYSLIKGIVTLNIHSLNF